MGKRKKAIQAMQQAKNSEKQNSHPQPIVYKPSIERYVLAAITEGMSETQAFRFTAKCGIYLYSKNEFYKAQEALSPKIIQLVQEDLKLIRDNLPDDSIIGTDCSWNGRRNALSAVVFFLEVHSGMIFDYCIVSRDKEISDIDFHKSSNMMEAAGVAALADKYRNNYKFIGFVHDFDLNSSPIFHEGGTDAD